MRPTKLHALWVYEYNILQLRLRHLEQQVGGKAAECERVLWLNAPADDLDRVLDELAVLQADHALLVQQVHTISHRLRRASEV
ncbi:hypothetical protein [Furfurilactobacillus entadae]|uniref:hypothetical protein n=1 Tax=Furfurilactobacillus entadae TaxID=2922307 RepID=UPI0035EFD8FF